MDFRRTEKEIYSVFEKYFSTGDFSSFDKTLRIIANYFSLETANDLPHEQLEEFLYLYLVAGYSMELFCFYINVKDDSGLRRLITDSENLNSQIKKYILEKSYRNIQKQRYGQLIHWLTVHKEVSQKVKDTFYRNNNKQIKFASPAIKKHESITMYNAIDIMLKRKDLSLAPLDSDEIMILKELYQAEVLQFAESEIRRTENKDRRTTYITIHTENDRFIMRPYPFYLINIKYSRKRHFAYVQYGYMAAHLAGGGNIVLFAKHDGYWEYCKVIGQWIS